MIHDVFGFFSISVYTFKQPIFALLKTKMCFLDPFYQLGFCSLLFVLAYVDYEVVTLVLPFI